MYNQFLCTLAEAKRQIKTGTTTDDALILESIEDASARIVEYFRVPFEPVIDTRYYNAEYRPVSYNGRVLTLNMPLLSAASVTLGDGTALAPTDYQLSPRDATPAGEIIITSDFYSWYTVGLDGQRRNVIEIAGTWGMHQDYAHAWSSVTTLSAAIVSASATSVTVVSGTAISPGALIRVDNEMMRVTGVATNTLTVVRGENGSTAALHNNAGTVELYAWDRVITRACARLAAWLHFRRGAFENSQFDVATGTTTQYPLDMPHEVMNIIAAYRVPTSSSPVVW